MQQHKATQFGKHLCSQSMLTCQHSPDPQEDSRSFILAGLLAWLQWGTHSAPAQLRAPDPSASPPSGILPEPCCPTTCPSQPVAMPAAGGGGRGGPRPPPRNQQQQLELPADMAMLSELTGHTKVSAQHSSASRRRTRACTLPQAQRLHTASGSAPAHCLRLSACTLPQAASNADALSP